MNDNLIDFCLRRLQEQLAAKLTAAVCAKRFHFFNSFFFKKLAEDVEPAATASQHRCGGARADAAHARVRKWTSRVDIFDKDFLIVPVNQATHWTLAIVCHPGAAPRRAAQTAVVDLTVDIYVRRCAHSLLCWSRLPRVAASDMAARGACCARRNRLTWTSRATRAAPAPASSS